MKARLKWVYMETVLDEESAESLAQLHLIGLLLFIPLAVLLLILGIIWCIFVDLHDAFIDWNDERVIRSMERDIVATARRMNKVAAR